MLIAVGSIIGFLVGGMMGYMMRDLSARDDATKALYEFDQEMYTQGKRTLRRVIHGYKKAYEMDD